MQYPISAPRSDGHVQTPGGIWITGDYFLAETQTSQGSYEKNPCVVFGCKLETYQKGGNTRVAQTGKSADLDISWLPYAAEQYQISPRITDYVLVEVPIVVADIPNRNMDAFPYTQLTAWRTANSRPAFATFIGKPVHADHDNMDDTKAKGVIFDATLTKFRNRYHVKILKGFDRTKDARLAGLVQKKNRIGHSMGALVEKTMCSLPSCKYVSDGTTTCTHISGGTGKGKIKEGQLIYEDMLDFYYIESSSVEDPAYVVALSERIW